MSAPTCTVPAAVCRQVAISVAFLVQGLLFFSLTLRLPQITSLFDLSDVQLSGLMLLLVLLAGTGSVGAEVVACHRDCAGALRAALVLIAGGILVLGVSLTGSGRLPVLVAGMAVDGVGLGANDAASTMQAVALKHRLGRPVLPSLHAAWTAGGVLATSGAIALPGGRCPAPLRGRGPHAPLRRRTPLSPRGARSTSAGIRSSRTHRRHRTLRGTSRGAGGRAHGIRRVGDRRVRSGIDLAGGPPFFVVGLGVAVVAPSAFSATARVAGLGSDDASRQARVDAVIAQFNTFNYVGALLGSVLTGAVGTASLRIGYAVPMVLVLRLVPLARLFSTVGVAARTPAERRREDAELTPAAASVRVKGTVMRPRAARPGGRRATEGCGAVNGEQFEKMKSGKGFIAALDQSGGSTPKALGLYGVDESSYANEDEMFDLVHQMRTRIITSSAFTGDRILAAILFEMTMEREIQGQGTAEYLWREKNVVPILKVDKGLAEESDGVQVMKPMPELDDVLQRAIGHGVFGTKMRSVIKMANQAGVDAVVGQQFEIGRQIIASGLVPIIEPEVDIHSPEKSQAEVMLKEAMLAQASALGADEHIMLKLTPPEEDDFYKELVEHPNVVRVVALSGGYSRDDANERLSRQHGVVASFSRALTEGLSAGQSDAEFDATLDSSIESIYQASLT